MNIKLFILSFLAFLWANLIIAQTTAIPDANFEQELINQGIDTDGTVNGQVATTDISSRSSLNINNANITDFTGLQDFASLEFLNYDSSTVISLNIPSGAPLLRSIRIQNHPNLSTVVIPPSNVLESITISNCNLTSFVLTGSFPILEDLYLTSNNLTSLDVSQLNLADLRLSNNQITELNLGISIFLENLDLTNNNLRVLNLSDTSNNNQNITDLNINDNPNLECVQVNDPVNIPTSWTFTTNVNPSFSANCYVNIPDASFEQELIAQGIDTDGVVNGQASAQDLRTVTTLNVNAQNIADLTGIEAFLALEELNVSNNQSLTALDLSANTNLERLIATNVGLNATPNFGANTSYTQMIISNSNFSTIDVSAFTALETLGLSTNGLASITLGNKPNLTVLDVTANSLSSLDVTSAPELVDLFLFINPISDIDLSQNLKLELLNAGQTGLLEIDLSSNPLLSNVDLVNCPSLEYANLKNDDRQDLLSLSMTSCPNLVCVELDDLNFINTNWTKDFQTNYSTSCFTQIPDANFEQELITKGIDSDGVVNGRTFTSDVASVTNLSLVDQIADYTGIEDFIALQVFQVGGITSSSPSNINLNLSNNIQLETLNLTMSGLTSLVLPSGSLLKFLGVSDSPIMNIDLTQTIGLEQIRIERNALSSLDVSALANLERLELTNNQLTQLDTSQNSNLQVLSTSNNPITSLDLSANNSFVGLISQNTDLSSLILKTGNGTNDISQIIVTGNPNLECIEVDDENNIPSGWSKDATASYSNSCAPTPTFVNAPIDISSAYTATIEFDTAVTGFELSDIVITGGTLSNFQAVSGTEYSVLVTPTSFCASSVSLEVPINVAEDAQNRLNSSSGVVTIATNDDESPTVVLQDITVMLDADGQATLIASDLDNGSSDNCTLNGDLDFGTSSTTFTCADLGANTISVLVSDDEGNTQAGSATVTVVDNLDPEILVNNITVQLDASGNATITPQDIDNGSSDNCSIASLALDVTDFSCTDLGTNTVVLTVTDNSGKAITASATVTVEQDPNQPLIAIAQDITIQLDANGIASIIPQDVDNGSTSGCGNFSLSLNKDTFNCDDIGLNTVTLTVIEGSNTVTATAEITVEDNLAPIISCPSNETQSIVTGNTYTLPDYFGTALASATDNCTIQSGLATTYTQSPAPGTQLSDGTYTITLSAVDNANNTGSCTFTVEIDETLSTNDFTLSEIKLYPNPSSSYFELSNAKGKVESLQIYSIDGKLIKTMKFAQRYSVEELLSGIYFVRINAVNNFNQSRTIRLIKD